MSGFVHHFVRRGLDQTYQRFQKTQGDGNPTPISACATAVLVATVLTYMAVMFAVWNTWLHHLYADI